MRLARLDLTRYGKFTDTSLEFGTREEGRPDLHIVYGPNEAGKSTALAAILDLLFGIETRSRFNFIHPHSSMRVGARLELADGPRDVVRVKRAQNSLLDGADRPIADAVVLGELAGIDREAYRTMFSLDDETLEEGGESILASKGDLGQLLFSASAGLSDLSRNLVEIRAEADRFYRFRARGGELADLKARLAALKDEREKSDTFAPHYAQLVVARDLARGQYDLAVAEHGRLRARMDEIQRMLNALPRLAALRDVRQRLAPLADLPAAPPGWAERLPAMQKDEIALETRLGSVESEIGKLTSGLDEIVVDPRALALAERSEWLADLRARHVTADKDLPDRELRLREINLSMGGILARIGRENEPDPGKLVLPAATVAALRAAIERRSGIDAAIGSADGELTAVRHQLDDAIARLEEAGGVQEDGRNEVAKVASLASIVAALRAGDHVARRRLAIPERDTQQRLLGDRLRELHPWQGDADRLLDSRIPDPATVERWKTSLAEIEKRLDRQDREVERLTEERDTIEAERKAIGVTGVVGDGDASAVRQEREQRWAEHRRTLDEASATVFETALRQDDTVTAARLGRATEVARLHQAGQAIAALDVRIARAQRLGVEAQASRQKLRDEFVGALRAISADFADDISVPRLETWIAGRRAALDVRDKLLAAERELGLADADEAAGRQRLTEGLAAAGVVLPEGTSFDTLLAAAQTAIDRESELNALREKVRDRRRDLARREQAIAKAMRADVEWTDAWTQACSACWLGANGAVPAREAVREILTALGDLSGLLEQRASLADRIDKMRKDQATFAEEIGAVARELAIVLPAASVLELAREVDRRTRAATLLEADRTAKLRALKEAEESKRALRDELAVHMRQKSELTEYFGVNSLAEVGARLQGIEHKTNFEKEAASAAHDITTALRLTTIGDAEQVLDGVDRSGLEAELAELGSRLADQDGRSRTLFLEHGKAADAVEAVGGDDAVAHIEERRRTTQLEIEDKALTYLKLRLGSAAADHALRAYREQHRSSMMARASDAFRTISRGAYARLATQPDKDGDMLIAIAADGGSKVASELSRGARFQLYLALRVAGYHEFVQARRPVPFIADDIMESFDDFRAEEAFRVFAGMAGVGQVIYFTHHRHLCEIARRVCPGVRLHGLGADACG